jgi:hypothetical protein
MSNQFWAITLGHIAILYIRKHHIAGIKKVAKPMYLRYECVGDLLQMPSAVGHVFISVQWDVRCLFGWVMLASASQAIKMLPL